MFSQTPDSECIVRFSYFDEAGIANPKHEPYTVVAGIMIHADDQYQYLQKYILDIADDLVGKDRPQDFVFHAKELWHGGKFFPRDKWSREKRFEILGHLTDIPRKYQFPLIYACVERAKFPAKNPADRKSRAQATRKCHMLCFLSCLSQTDEFVGAMYPGEMAFVVAEDHNEHRVMLRDGANILGNPRLAQIIKDDPGVSWKPNTHLVDEPLFQKKSGNSPLQVADVCAFILSRHFAADSYIAPLVEKIKPQLIRGLRTEFVARKIKKMLSRAQGPS